MSGATLVLVGNVLFWVGLGSFGLWLIVQTARDKSDRIVRALKNDARDWTDEEAYLSGPDEDQLRREFELLERIRKGEREVR